MSTRSIIVVKDDIHSIQLYRHCDGYPDGPHGVIADLAEATPFAWPLPRFEASDFAAAIVRAWKTSGGNVYIEGTAEIPDTLHSDEAYLYIVTEPTDSSDNRPEVKVYKASILLDPLWTGRIGDDYPDNL